MFICSFRMSNIRFALGAVLSIAVIAAMIIIIPSAGEKTASPVSNISYDGIASEEDIIVFIESLGYTPNRDPVEIEDVTIPDEFDRVFINYNEIQKKQGLDLSGYKRKKVRRYTYSLTDFPNYQGTVYINVIIYRSKVIGGDICSADPSGFVCGFDGKIDTLN